MIDYEVPKCAIFFQCRSRRTKAAHPKAGGPSKRESLEHVKMITDVITMPDENRIGTSGRARVVLPHAHV